MPFRTARQPTSMANTMVSNRIEPSQGTPILTHLFRHWRLLHQHGRNFVLQEAYCSCYGPRQPEQQEDLGREL